MDLEQSFTNRRWFPGETGNPLDVVLHRFEAVQRIHPLLFGLGLAILAFLISGINLTPAILLGVFFFCDWLLLALLPAARISFGPPQPPVLILAALRSIVGVVFGPFAWPLQFLGSFFVIYGFWIEPQQLTLTRQTLVSEKFHAHTSVRLLHLGDLHIERITSREKKLSKLISELKPDLILFSGDILNLSNLKDPQARLDARSVIGSWQAPLGTFLVPGSPAVDEPGSFEEILTGLPITLLQDQKQAININNTTINIIGLRCSHRPHQDGPALKALIANIGPGLNILLYHSPDLSPIAARSGIDLQLSGHTHGGQIRLPFFGALVTGSLYGKRFEVGRMLVEKMTLYVSRGIGMEGAAAPRVRFLCPPEIILWELTSSQS